MEPPTDMFTSMNVLPVMYSFFSDVNDQQVRPSHTCSISPRFVLVPRRNRSRLSGGNDLPLGSRCAFSVAVSRVSSAMFASLPSLMASWTRRTRSKWYPAKVR